MGRSMFAIDIQLSKKSLERAFGGKHLRLDLRSTIEQGPSSSDRRRAAARR
jgi:hypothetical protein